MPSLHEAIDLAVDRGIKYLHQHQFPNGEFCGYISWGDDDMNVAIHESSVFPTSLIGYSLLNLKHISEVQEIHERSAGFLQYQSMRGGIWPHFTSWTPLYKVCPPDVDNTSCASKLLQALKKDYIPNRNILLLNRAKTGLFYSWYTLRFNWVWDKDYWLLCLRDFKYPIMALLFWKNVEAKRYDIDAVVNSNVLFYLGLDKDTEAIVPYLIDVIRNNRESECDLWYLNPFTIWYFFSRNFKVLKIELQAIREPIIQRILHTTKKDGSFGESVLDTALGIIVLLNLDYDISNLDNAINYLIDAQEKYGEWPRRAVYYGGPKKLQCYGSEELTTGFCLEALSLYQQSIKNESI
ncbi:prenyltransferase/squalene oxidase repeat-containing protein [Pedobacter jejuensis]|uniref:Squalene cyclase C-terminal domain-containing protein n=1 Tax=Pedobacter jejuensis TaxID=1268550 RepID=A0A3N0BTX0_9SPHI|nr:hypothetical protein [Pedobacter jejuensis]RNL52536.1 hypothetical protein D7004_13390 [Pedobacter jejuensis]